MRDARRRAQRVIGPRVAEVVEPAEEVGRVGAEVGELGGGALERLLGDLEGAVALAAVGLERARGDVAQRHLQLGQLDQVVGGAGSADDLRQVVDGRARVARERAQLGQERAQLLGDRLRVIDERVEVVERGAQVDERRVGAALEVGQAADRLGERLLLVADRGRRGGELVDEAGQVLVAVGDVGDELRRGDDEALEQRGVAVELAEQPTGGGERRVEVGDALVELLALALDLVGRAVDHALQRLARLRVEGVEDLVEVDGGGRRVLLDHALVGDPLGALRRHPQVDVAVGDARQRGLADGGQRAAAQRRVVLVDLHRHRGLAVLGEVDAGDLADRRAAGLDQVALYELGGVLEVRGDGVAAARATEQEDGNHDGDDKNGGRSRRAHDLIPGEPHSPEPRTRRQARTCGPP